jgi:CDP-diacylglycerol---glycerol-3-phosphate 3-phosphatidyltransferase
LSIANYLTLIRLLMGPLFLWTYLEYERLQLSVTTLPYALLVLLGISELSDFCDGYFARKYNEVTDLGKILDPMADSIYRLSVFLTFTLPPIQLPMVLIFILFYRDSVISTLRTICALKGMTLAARPSGKLKAVIQALTACLVILLLIPYSLGLLNEELLHRISTILVTMTSIYTLLSGFDYLYANRFYIVKLLLDKNSQTPAIE